MISQIDSIFKKKKLDLWLKPYEIVGTGQKSGILEFIEDSMAISGIKEKLGGRNARLIHFFTNQFGSQRSKSFKQARLNFC